MPETKKSTDLQNLSRRFFFEGNSGSGKSFLSSFFPDPLYILSDPGGVTGMPNPVDYWEISTLKDIIDASAEIEKDTHETIITDSMTLLNWFMVRGMAASKGKDTPDWDERKPAAEKLRMYFTNLVLLPKNKDVFIVFITTLQTLENQVDNTISYAPNVPGKTSGELPPFCDEVWRFFTRVAPPKGPNEPESRSHWIQTVEDAKYPGLKTRGVGDKGKLKVYENVTGEEGVKRVLTFLGVLK